MLFFNPGQMSPEEIEAHFIARREVFGNLLQDVLAETDETAPQHHLIIGQRGMGKTTLLHRLAVELNKAPHRDRFLPLTFPEEQYILISRLSDFWLNVLDAAATALETRGDKAAAAKLDQVIASLPKNFRDEGTLCEAARGHFTRLWKEELRLRPVLLLDNFPNLLERLNDHHWDLRAWLQEPGAPVLVATAIALPESLGTYDSAFFDAFKARVLYRMTLPECREVCVALAERERRPDLIAQFRRQEARMKTLHTLTGGNPRTVGMLYELFARGLGADAWEDLRSMLDRITPLYQSRLDQLSDTAQKVFAALALSWRPVLQHEVTEQTGLPQGTVSSTLQRLEETGVVERVDIVGKKKLGWQLAERFFNVWFLMRFASRRTKGNIAALAGFLERYYSRDELRDIANSLLSHPLDGEETHYAFAVASALGDCTAGRAITTHASLELLRLKEEIGEKMKDLFDLDVPQPVVDFFELRDKILPALVPPDSGIEPKEFAKAVVSSISILDKRKIFAATAELSAFQVRSLMDGFKEEHVEFAKLFDETAIHNVEKLLYRGLLTDKHDETQLRDAIDSVTQCKTAMLLSELIPDSFPELKEVAYRKAIALDEKYPRPWFNMGWLLSNRLSRYEEAESAYRKAIALDENDATPWNNLGNLLSDKHSRYEEAEAAYRKAIALDEKDARPWFNLGWLLADKLSRYEEAESAYRKAIALDEKFAMAWNNLGTLLSNKLSRYEEAESAYRKAIALDENFSMAWDNLGWLLTYKLSRYEEAEVAYRKAISLDEKDATLWSNLGWLLTHKLSCYEEAAEAYRKAIALDEKDARLWNNLGNLLADYLGKPEEAETWYRKLLELEVHKEVARVNLVFLLRDQLGRVAEAEALLGEIKDEGLGFPEVVELHRSLFSLYRENLGDAKGFLRAALERLGDVFKPHSIDDWYRAAAVWLHHGRGAEWQEVWDETGASMRFLPFAEAVRAHHLGSIDFINNIPVEAREVAREIFKEIERRRKPLGHLRSK